MNPSLARSSTSLFRTALRRHSHLPAPRIPQQSLVRLAPTARPFSTSQASMSVQAITSYDEFKKLINGDKIVAVDFWATWCGPCKMISPLFEKFAAEAPADKIAFYKVDVDEQEQISQEVGIKAMPTFVFFKKGEKVTEVVGAVPQKLQAAIKDVCV